MINSPETDMGIFFKSLAKALQSYADEKNIKLDFTVKEKEIKIHYPQSELLAGFTKLIASIMDYMPDNNMIYISAGILERAASKYVSIKIRNTGINLKMVNAIIKNSALPVTLISSGVYETTYEICYSLKEDIASLGNAENENAFNYTTIIKGIQTYFAKINDPVSRLAESKPKEAAFLININKCILDNIDDERFDANALSTAMAMSRAQLLRRLKALTGNSPGFHIKTMRLEKAKELLEKSDLTVSETAFNTGFGTPSNFTKVFTEKYGITPSQFRRINSNATNK